MRLHHRTTIAAALSTVLVAGVMTNLPDGATAAPVVIGASAAEYAVVPTPAPSTTTLPAQTVTERLVDPLARAERAERATRSRIRVSVPLYGRVTARFGERNSRWQSRHTGLDIRANYGSRVRSAMAGRVVEVAYQQAYGRVVVIRSGGVDLWYAHLSKDSVRVGQQVKRGQVIGRVGTSGNSSGPHLHLEVRRNDLPTNPATFLWGRPAGKPSKTPAWAKTNIQRLADL